MIGLYPSNADRWMQCAGSVSLSQPFLEREAEVSDARLEGIAAHWVAEQLHRGTSVPLGVIAPNGVEVDEEMLDAAHEYVSLLSPLAYLETKVDLSCLHPGMNGRVDASWHTDGHAHVFDFKYGHSRVEEYENWQFLVEIAGYDFRDLGVTDVTFHIFQPRCYQAEAHRTWTVSVEEYNRVYLPQIKAQVARIVSGDISLQTGSSCRSCLAAAVCPVLASVAYETVDRVALGAMPVELTPEVVARELDVLTKAAERLKARLMGLEEQATGLIKGGTAVPGYTLKPTQGRLGWSVPVDAVLSMGQLSGVDLLKPKAALTPTQAVKAGMPQGLVDSISSRPPTSPKLTKVNLKLTARRFKQ